MSYALHAAAGIVLAIVAVELMPEALAAAPGWILAIAFMGGTLLYIAVEWVVESRLERSASSPGSAGMWMIYIAVAVDLFSDGLMIGAGTAVSISLALTLALGQVLADVPEGFATIANFKNKGIKKRRSRILLSASFVIPVVSAAVLSYFLLRDQSEVLKMAALILTAGLLTVASVEDMIREAHDAAKDNRISVLAFSGGFALFTLVATSLG